MMLKILIFRRLAINLFIRNIYLLITLVVILISSYLLIYNSFVYGLSDAYYYCSIAESLEKTGKLFDYTSESISPVITTQNGIVFIHYLLMKIGFTDIHFRLEVMSYINVLFLIVIVFLLKKIFENIFRVNSKITAFILLIFVLTPEVYTSLLQPINDVYFTLLSLSFIYILLSKTIDKKLQFILLLIITILINHFRIQGVFLFISIIIINIYLRKYKEIFLYTLLLLISILSVKFVNMIFISDFSGIDNITNLTISKMSFSSIYSSLKNIMDYTMPILFFSTNKFASFYSSIFYLMTVFILFFGYKAFRDKHIEEMYIFLLIGANIVFLSLFLVQEARYLVLIYPMVLYILSRYINNYNVYKIYILLLFIIICGRFIVFDTKHALDRMSNINFNVNYSINKVNSNKFKDVILVDYDLISENKRVTYFLFNKSDVRYNETTKNNVVYVGEKLSFNKLLMYFKTKGYKVYNTKEYQYDFLIRNGLNPDSKIFSMNIEH